MSWLLKQLSDKNQSSACINPPSASVNHDCQSWQRFTA
jgi:hypothetical protein